MAKLQPKTAKSVTEFKAFHIGVGKGQMHLLGRAATARAWNEAQQEQRASTTLPTMCFKEKAHSFYLVLVDINLTECTS